MMHAILLTLLLGTVQTGELGKGLVVDIPLVSDTLDGNGYPRDATPNNLTASSETGTVTYASTGATFDGSSYLTYSTATQTALTGDFTVAVWFKHNQTSTEVMPSYLINAANQWQIANSISVAGDIRFFMSVASVSATIVSTGTYNDNAWHLALVTRSGSTITLYVDNVSEGTDSLGTDLATNGAFVLGRISAGNEYTGSMQGVKIWDRALSTAERGYAYDQGPRVVAIIIEDSNTNYLQVGELGKGLKVHIPASSDYLAGALWADATVDSQHMTGVNSPTIGATNTTFASASTEYLYWAESLWRSSDTLGCFAGWYNATTISANMALWGVNDEATGAGSAGHHLYAYVATTGAIAIVRRELGTRNIVVTADTPISTGTTYHIAVCSSGSIYAIWVDGVSKTLNITEGLNNGGWLSGITATDSLTVGAIIQSGSAIATWNGTIGDFRYYNRNLPSAEINYLVDYGERP